MALKVKNLIFTAALAATLWAAGCSIETEKKNPPVNETAITISSPTNNQTVYNPVVIAGNYYDELTLSGITVFAVPVSGGVTNQVTAHTVGNVLYSFTAELTNLADGFHYIWAKAINQSDQITVSSVLMIDCDAGNPDTNNYDFVAPVSVILSHTNNQIVSSSFSVSGNATDDKSGIDAVWLDVDGNGYQVISQTGGIWQTNITLLTEGDHTISTYASDLSNNISLTNSIVVNFLASLPSILINDPVNNDLVNSSTIDINGTSSVSSGSISLVQVKINGGSYVSATGTDTWSLNGATLGIQGTNIIYVRAISSADVTNQVSVTLVLDSGSPNVSISAPTQNALITSLPLTFNGTAGDTTTWISNVRISLDNINYIDATGTDTWTSTPSVIQGSNTLYVVAIDAAGNQSSPESVDIIVDTVGPEVTVDSLPANVSAADLKVTGTAQDQVTGVDTVYISLNSGSFQAVTGTANWTNNLTLVSGNNTIRVYATDTAGNSSATNTSSVSYGAPVSLTVNLKLPAGWSTPSLYFYDADPTNLTTTWAGAPNMTNAGSGWWTITFAASEMRIIFKDGTHQIPAANQPGMLVSSNEQFYWTNDQWYFENPETPVDLSCEISSPANNAKVTVTNVTITGVAYAVSSLTAVYVSINGGSYNTASGTSSWTYNTDLILGTNTISAYAVGNGGDHSETNTIKVIRRESGNNPHPGTYSGRKGAWLYSDGVEFSTFWRSQAADSVYVAGDFTGWDLWPLTNRGDNVWWAFFSGIQAGANYKMVGIKGNTTNWVHDIYGAYTHGQNGNSIVVDHTEFTWTDGSWTRPSWDYYSIYEININEFTANDTSLDASVRGTYLGMAQKMQYLADLGITCIELMPIQEFGIDGPGWGYDPAVMSSVESSYGTQPFVGYETINELKTLIDTAHEHGIAVILDVVWNHMGPTGSNPYWTMDPVMFFDWDNDGTVEAQQGGDDNSPWGNKVCTWRTEVQDYAKEVMEYWITEYHVDGFRYDAANTSFMADEFIWAMKNYLEPKYPNLFTSVESVGVQATHQQKGPQWSFIYSKNAHKVMEGSLGIADANYNNYNQSFMDNINAGIYNSSVPYSSSPWHVVNYFDSHDEKSLAAYLYNSGDNQTAVQWKSRLAIATLVASKGFPMFYGGQEFGNDRDTPDEGETGRTDIRPLDWSSYTANKTEIWDYYAGMLTLRKNHPALRNLDAQANLIYGENNGAVGYRFEKSGDNTFIIFLNYGGDKSSFSLSNLGSGTWTLVANPTTFLGESSGQTYTEWDTINFNGNSALVFMQ